MTGDPLLFFVIAGALAAVLAKITIWSPRRLWVKLTALGVTALFLPLAYLAFSDLLSRPKPVQVEWVQRGVKEAEVLAVQYREDEAIYIWLGLAGTPEPRAYALPWSEQAAKQLHEAMREAEEKGTGVQMRDPFEPSHDESEPLFYARPQDPPPEKAQQADNPLVMPAPEGAGAG
ncbi:MAG: hypothetical protein AAF495_10720 [Pseudomonadota bacterium]